jgi:hypothetical protein
MFRITDGTIELLEVDLLRDPRSVKNLAANIIEFQRLNDRYANPEHPQYDPQFADDTTKRYAEMLEAANNLECIALHADDDLVILKVYDQVEFPDMESLGIVSEKMKQQFRWHKRIWQALSEYERGKFLVTLNDLQSCRSNQQQYDLCAEQGLSYRLVLYEMESRGMKNRSRYPANHSDLLSMEDVQAWHLWRRDFEDELQKHRILNQLVSDDPV